MSEADVLTLMSGRWVLRTSGFLMDDIPGTFFFVGSANADRDLDFGHHHPRFDFDESALPLSVALMSSAIASYVLSDEA
jgi:metal-dependent amidase/aminoacylase/carboxypeptidase family protein